MWTIGLVELVRCRTMKRRCVPVVLPAEPVARFAEMRNQIFQLFRLVAESQTEIGRFLEQNDW